MAESVVLATLVEELQKRIEDVARDVAAVSKVAAQWQDRDTVDVFEKTAEALMESARFQDIMARITEMRFRNIAKDVDGWLGRPFLNNREAAKLIGITPTHLSAMRKDGKGPAWSGSGKWVRYERTVVEQWIRDLPT